MTGGDDRFAEDEQFTITDQDLDHHGFPAGTIPDTDPGRVLVPFGEKGHAVYQIKSNGNAVIRTVLRCEPLTENRVTMPDRFWMLETADKIEVVRAALARRFPSQSTALSGALEAVDPFDVVYPDNPDEYYDVVMEFLVLTARVNADITRLSRHELEAHLSEALARCFGEQPLPDKVSQVADRLTQPGT